MNPLLRKHLYSSTRKNRFFWLLTAYLVGVLLLMSFFLLISAAPILGSSQHTYSMTGLFILGRGFYWFSGIVLLYTGMLLVPIGALGAIAGEREGRTLELLRTTTLRAKTILLGKLGGVMLTGLVYLLAPLPLLLGWFWIGGITDIELFLTVLMLATTTLLFVSWAIFLSSLMRKTITAVLFYYTVNIFILPIIQGAAALFFGDLLPHYVHSERFPNSFWLTAFCQYAWVLVAGLHPLPASIATEALGLDRGSWYFIEFEVSRWTDKGRSLWGTIILPSPWITFTLTSLVTSALLLWLTLRRLERPER